MVGDPAITSPVRRGVPPSSRYPQRPRPWAAPLGPQRPAHLHGQVGPSAADKNIGSGAVRLRAVSGDVGGVESPGFSGVTWNVGGEEVRGRAGRSGREADATHHKIWQCVVWLGDAWSHQREGLGEEQQAAGRPSGGAAPP